MDKIFTYSNYREYLKDYFEQEKKTKHFFSQRYFAQKAGFKSHTYTGRVIRGERNFSEDAIEKMLKGIGLSGKEAEYFTLLVHKNQSKSDEEKDKLSIELTLIKRELEFKDVDQRKMAYYDNWYIPILRHLAVYADWNNDYKKLSQLVYPQITEEEAEEGVRTLLKIGMLKEDNGNYSHFAHAISVDDLPKFIKEKGRRDILKKGIEALDTLPVEERLTVCSLLSMSENSYTEITGILEETWQRINTIVANDNDVEGVYQLIFQLFPQSKKIGQNV